MATRKTPSGNFGTPTFLSHVNSNGNEWAPEFSTDGLKLFFMSNMDNPYSTSLDSLQLWMASRMSVSEPFKAPVKLPPNVNMAGYGTFWPGLSPDCSVLYFVSNRPGGFGGYDLWQVSISPVVDFNGDGIVDSADMCIMVDHWGENYPLCDIGPTPFGDGIVDVQDLIVLAEHLFEDYRIVAHWALDETEGAVAYDTAGDRDGFLFGDPLWQPTEGKKDGALQFDGIDDYVVSVPVINPADGPFSVFAWIKGSAPGQVIISQMDGTGSGETWLGMDAVSGCLMTGLVPPSVGRYTPQPLVSESIITDSQWHHVGFAWDGSYRVLYVDGTEVAADTAALDPLNFSNGGLYIGAGKTLDAGTFFAGLIDDIRIYNQALCVEEIAALAQ
jgi:hypothetical protein